MKEEKYCLICKSEVIDFKNDIDRINGYQMGMCQRCLDKYFGRKTKDVDYSAYLNETEERDMNEND